MRATFVRIAAALAVLAIPVARAADDSTFCSTCELQFGLGGTYHYWGTTHSLVIPMIVNVDEHRWELAAFRFTGPQRFYDTTFLYHITFAEPYWGFSLSRRILLFEHKHWSLVAGLGASYKTREDRLSSSLWNFAYQAGVRLTPAEGVAIELVGRHWSNSGLKLPNHGQDFAALTFSIYPTLIAKRWFASGP
jgi:Lipid A 3-O-deacylase (PagL)